MDTLLNILIAIFALTIPFLFAWVMVSLKVTRCPFPERSDPGGGDATAAPLNPG